MSAQYCGCDMECKTGPHYCRWHIGQKKAIVAAEEAILMAERSEKVAPGPTRASSLPTVAAERKKFPVATGVLDYFPDAIVAIANVSWQGNEQHNPGEPLHWARGKSMDQDDTMIRHFLERGTFDTDGQRHSAKMAWRALAILQLEIEAEREAK